MLCAHVRARVFSYSFGHYIRISRYYFFYLWTTAYGHTTTIEAVQMDFYGQHVHLVCVCFDNEPLFINSNELLNYGGEILPLYMG